MDRKEEQDTKRRKLSSLEKEHEENDSSTGSESSDDIEVVIGENNENRGEDAEQETVSALPTITIGGHGHTEDGSDESEDENPTTSTQINSGSRFSPDIAPWDNQEDSDGARTPDTIYADTPEENSNPRTPVDSTPTQISDTESEENTPTHEQVSAFSPDEQGSQVFQANRIDTPHTNMLRGRVSSGIPRIDTIHEENSTQVSTDQSAGNPCIGLVEYPNSDSE